MSRSIHSIRIKHVAISWENLTLLKQCSSGRELQRYMAKSVNIVEHGSVEHRWHFHKTTTNCDGCAARFQNNDEECWRSLQSVEEC